MIEHLHWRGCDYKAGIEGQRLALIGYSHWGEEDDTPAEGTRTCIRRVIAGEYRLRFFTSIRNYFGFYSHSEFWRRVIFFNYLPESIGDGDERFNWGTEEQIHRAQKRFLSILENEQPHKVLVLTKKGWLSCPPTHEQNSPSEGPPLPLTGFPGFSWRTYELGGTVVRAFGLRHPQGANGELMRRAVRHVLDIPIS